jgi:outer membrane protein OmpA-like peptidoglycan-associated protein
MKKLKGLFLFIFICSIGFGQIKKAEKYYANLDFAKAIPLYEKVAKHNSVDKQYAMIKLADCYRILNNYAKSENYYAQAFSIGNVPAIVNYNYGNILKSNNKYAEALEQYHIYLDSNKSSKTAQYAIKSCQEIKYWDSKPKEYDVKNIEAINTKRSEFSPYVLNNNLIFVGEKTTDIVDFETSSTNNQPFLNVFSSEIKNSEVQKGKLLSKTVNSNFHDGPISYTEDGKLAAFTRVDYVVNKKNKNFVNRAKIYFTKVDGTKYSKVVPFTFNSDEYSCSHPSLSSDGLLLYFSSDMPGTYGGQDIWVSKKNGDVWEKPINLGFDINTSEDEVFPTITKLGKLYFSSNGLPGFGDLDIFSAKQFDGKWLLNRNEGLNLNSKSDDFGITFINDSTGYFSSNREGGKGEDDIYYFKFTNKSTTVEGSVLLTENVGDPAKNVKVYLLDNDGKAIDSTFTNEKGYFVFNNLDLDKTYMAEIEANEISLNTKSRYYLADKNLNITRITHNKGSEKKFVFRNLPIDPNGIPDLYNDDDLSLSGNLLIGDKALANKKVTITNSYGDVVVTTTTDEFGSFVFRNLPLDQNYSISVDDSDIPLSSKIIMTNKKGKEVKFLRSQSKDNFKYTLLGIDKESLSDLNIEDDFNLAGTLLVGESPGKPLENKKVYAKNEFGEIIAETYTNEFGAFAFRNLPLDQNYSISIDESDIPLNSKITLKNKVGKEIKVVNSGNKGEFKFELLGLDKQSLSDLSIEDIDLRMALNGYLYDQDKKALGNMKVAVVNNSEVVENLLTDAKGKFVFKNLLTDKSYVLQIDESDPRFNLITKIYVADAKGRVYKEILRDILGKFEFALLEIDKTALGDYSIDDPWLQVLNLKNKKKDKNKDVTKVSAKVTVSKSSGEQIAFISEHLYYAFGDYHIDDAGYNVLDKVITVLYSNRNLKIELSSHTDSRSSDEFNLALSQKRANEVAEYLMSKGIRRDRLKAIGYGETKLLNKCENGVLCTEEEHALNRRTEFKIFEIDKK